MLSYNKSIIPIIESSYEDLTNVEKMIADYFLNGVENDELSSKDVSKKGYFDFQRHHYLVLPRN